MSSCSKHAWIRHTEDTIARGNNFNIKAYWLVSRCANCGVEERELLSTDYLTFEGRPYDYTSRTSAPTRFDT